jgi:hypothetical protein
MILSEVTSSKLSEAHDNLEGLCRKDQSWLSFQPGQRATRIRTEFKGLNESSEEYEEIGNCEVFGRADPFSHAENQSPLVLLEKPFSCQEPFRFKYVRILPVARIMMDMVKVPVYDGAFWEGVALKGHISGRAVEDPARNNGGDPRNLLETGFGVGHSKSKPRAKKLNITVLYRY